MKMIVNTKQINLIMKKASEIWKNIAKEINEIVNKPKTSKEQVAIKIVTFFNEDMGGKWDSKMYEQKKVVLELMNNLKIN